jgi:predicted Zn-dependent protease
MTLRFRLIALIILAFVVGLPPSLRAKDDNKKREPRNAKEDVDAIGERDVGKGVNFYSLEKEIALGKSLAQDIERHAKIIDDAVVAEYVNRVGQNLVRNSDAKVPFTIKLIDSPEVNAFALPGGFFFVNSGLLLRAETEAELAGVMAHEIAHVAARHGTRQATRGQIINFASIPLLFMGGWTGYGIRQAAGFAIPMGFLKFSRSMEAEADFLGLQYLYAAGYDPNAFIDFFEKLKADEKRKPGTLAKLFASHPPHGSRIKKTQEHIAEVLPGRGEYVVSTSEFQTVQSRLQRLTFRSTSGEDPNRPRLRRAPSDSTDPVEEGEGGATTEQQPEEDERPTLKRR